MEVLGLVRLSTGGDGPRPAGPGGPGVTGVTGGDRLLGGVPLPNPVCLPEVCRGMIDLLSYTAIARMVSVSAAAAVTDDPRPVRVC